MVHIRDRAHWAFLSALAEPRPARREGWLRSAIDGFAQTGDHLEMVRATVELLRMHPVDARRLRADALAVSRAVRPFEVAWRGRSRISVESEQRRDIVDEMEVRFPTTHCQQAFYSLVGAPARTLSVESLAADLWPEADARQARARVNTLVWQMKTALGGAGERVRRHRELVSISIDDDECSREV
jgi:two-component SAPR family response regulator